MGGPYRRGSHLERRKVCRSRNPERIASDLSCGCSGAMEEAAQETWTVGSPKLLHWPEAVIQRMW